MRSVEESERRDLSDDFPVTLADSALPPQARILHGANALDRSAAIFPKLLISTLCWIAMFLQQVEACSPGTLRRAPAVSQIGSGDRSACSPLASGFSAEVLVFIFTTAPAYHATLGDLTALSSSWSGGALQNKAYVWDDMGNLTSRTDHIAGRLETFGYDFLNRLASSSVSSLAGAPTSTVPPPQSHSYSTNGNLLTKGSSATLNYNDPTRPHAVTSATVKNFNRSYAYDAAGYVVSDTKRTYAWTSFGQLRQLDYLAAPDLKDVSGNLVHPTATVASAFDFDSGGNRARQTKERIASNDSRNIEYTLYLGSYERELHQTKTSGGAPAVLAKTIHRHSLGGGVIYTRTVGGPDPGVKLMNVLADHLGSTDVILTGKWNGSAFANHTTERQSFDAWGERRSADTQVNFRATDGDAFRTGAQDHDRGYTGHEQLDDSGLIHMNGRIYDPELGRFLSPDPYVQIPEYSQNFNRYSYVLNNPLNATDPSGFSFLSKVFGKIGNWIKENWRTIVVMVVAVVATILTAGVATATAGIVYGAGASVAVASAAAYAAWGAAVGLITGGLSAALAGGDIGDVLRGALIGGISGALTGSVRGIGGWPGIIARGAVGGVSNAAMGGKFQDGFISAAATAAASPTPINSGDGMIQAVSKAVIAGAIGGTASSLGGGKFSNGAWTASFNFLISPSNSKIGAFNGISNGLHGIANSRSWGDFGRSMLQLIGLPRDFFPLSKWEAAPTGGKLPKSLLNVLNNAGGDEDSLLGVGVGGLNGHKAWHGGTNAGISHSLGIIGAPVQFLAGVFHEIDIWSDEAAPAEYKNQGPVNQLLDSLGDIVANGYGMSVGYLSTSSGSAVPFAMRTANYFPGPTDPWKTGKPIYGQQNPQNPANAWGDYP